MTEEKKPKMDDEEQSARFIELAEQIQAEDAEERFDEAMKRVWSTKKGTESGKK